MNNQPFTTRMDTDLLRRRAFINAKIDELTGANAIDFDAADLEGRADGAAVPTWTARRGGLTATAAGLPVYRTPDSQILMPSVQYDDTGNQSHSTPATIDWSGFTTATLISFFYLPSGEPPQVRCPGGLRAGTSGSVSSGGITHYGFQDKMTGLHRADGATGFVYERDGTTDTGIAIVCVTTHDTDAASPDEIRLWVDGVEENGTQNGSSGGLPWFSNLQVLLGTRGGPVEGLNGRLARWIGTPRKLTADDVGAVNGWFTALRATYA